MDAPTLSADAWRCPVCRAAHPTPTACCRRCGADLLLLTKIRWLADRLHASGRSDLAQAVAAPRGPTTPG